MKNLHGQFVALLKNIQFSQKDGQIGCKKFFAGRNGPLPLKGGVVLTWWFGSGYQKILENISYIITADISEFAGCDHRTIQETTEVTLG